VNSVNIYVRERIMSEVPPTCIEEYASEYHERKVQGDVDFESGVWVVSIEGFINPKTLVLTVSRDGGGLTTIEITDNDVIERFHQMYSEEVYRLLREQHRTQKQFVDEGAFVIELVVSSDVVEIKDVGEVSGCYEPDCWVVESDVATGGILTEKKLKSGYLVFEYLEWEATASGRMPRIQIDASVTEEGKLVIEGGLCFSFSWVIDEPSELSDVEQRFIEVVGGGEPRFIDGSEVVFLPKDDVSSDVYLVDDGGFWAIVPVSEFTVSNGLVTESFRRLQSLF
jgi:hypothetical protein